MTPLVSAIIPTHDRPALLATAVRGALTQTYPRLEVIVVDDGSEPAAKLPPDLARHERLTIVRSERSAGAGAARNVGAAHAQGTLLAFCDDDDVWLPGKTADQVQALSAAGPRVGVVESGYELTDEHGRVVKRYLPVERRDTAATLLRHQFILMPSTTLVRRDAFDQVGGFDPALRRMQDWDLWLRIADRHVIVTLPKIHAVRRQSTVPAGDLLPYYHEMTGRIRPRLDHLPPDARKRVLAYHIFMTGVLHAEADDPRAARRALLRAWRTDPTSLRPLLHLPRTLIGEAAWAGVRRAVRRDRPILERW